MHVADNASRCRAMGNSLHKLLDSLRDGHYCISYIVQEAFMLIRIEPSNGLAIYDQVVRQVKFAVADGALREGELAPSVREMARELAINPNTVARAYLQLQNDEVLETVRGTGLIVKKTAAARCRKERLELIQQRIRSVLVEAKQSRLEMDKVRQLVEKELTWIEKQEL
jgi:GntR family transcriptional regulator